MIFHGVTKSVEYLRSTQKLLSYTLAIIDVLQEWNSQKRAERAFKIGWKRDPRVCVSFWSYCSSSPGDSLDTHHRVLTRCQLADGISAVEPTRYQERFMERVREIIPVHAPPSRPRSQDDGNDAPARPADL